jgi:hypothetical protein
MHAPNNMADTGKNIVEDSTTDGFTPEVEESGNHQHTQALQGMAETQLELAAIAKTNTSADLAMEKLPTELTQQHLVTHQNRATEAFHIPEIAENILAHLAIEDLLHVEQVDRKLFAIIQGSPVLQTNLFLKPRQTGPFAMLCSTDTVRIARLWDLKPGQSPLFCRVKALVDDHATHTTSESGPTTNTGNMFLMLTSDDRLTTEPRGARVSSMLVCQPPVRVMKVTMSCCPQGKPAPNMLVDRDGHFVLKAEHGITMGHIVGAIKTMRELHYPCWANMRDRVVKKNRKKNRSESRAYELNPEARAYARWPEFRTVVTLEQDDPILLGWTDEYKGLPPGPRDTLDTCVGMYTPDIMTLTKNILTISVSSQPR